jgi:hypothetical protein
MYDNVDNDVVDDDDDDENGEVDVGEEEDDEVEENDVEEEDRSQDREAHFVRACTVEMYTDISQEPFGNLQEKCRTPSLRHPFCARLRSRNAHGHVTRGILCGNLEGKCQMPRIPPRLNTGP